MKFSLIICTYMRAIPLKKLLDSVGEQSRYPDEILIIDGSTNTETKEILEHQTYNNLKYYQVPPAHRGLTKQRNYGIERVHSEMDIVCFLDDDTILSPHYFEAILNTYTTYPDALGVGGYITNEVQWEVAAIDKEDRDHFYFDGFRRKESSRYRLRSRLGLDQKIPPAWYPTFGHGRSIGYLPPSGKIYQVEMLMGGVSSFPLSVLHKHKFSEYFEGYGLYEDADFTLRLSHLGSLYVNTNATLEHHHDVAGRPNQFYYGKMVMRNGWYVWRIKHPKTSIKSTVKWHSISLLLTFVRFTNVLTGPERKKALTESLGRLVGWCSLLFNKPKLQR